MHIRATSSTLLGVVCLTGVNDCVGRQWKVFFARSSPYSRSHEVRGGMGYQ
jgi:hypothetical protein